MLPHQRLPGEEPPLRRVAIPHAPTANSTRTEVNHQSERLLTVEEAAERLGTGVRFVRRLIHERRIRYVKLGKPVRIPESAISAYVDERTVEPVRATCSRYGRAA